ncbi:MAG: 3-phosphoglycerate dehydrogenase [Promethearchaeota archaeon Loki_b31]|nr:MAG: 3-phosphoglycerate dehydrogenase [Candidatus Lokiarchaeota archaeon Loki_b31]
MFMKILISDKLQEEGVKIFQENGFDVVKNFDITNEELKKEIGNYDGIVIRSRTKLTADVLEHATNLKAIGRAGVGLDNVDRAKAAELNIEVLNTPEAPSVSVAELALGLMFTLARHISNADRTMHTGEWNKKQYLGYTLKGKKLGLIGFGNIAKQLAKKAIALEMDVGVYSRFSKGPEAVEEAKNIGCKIYSSIDDLLKDAQIVSLHLPVTSQTENTINATNIKLMNKKSILINTARGKLIEEKALIDALVNKEIGGAALDVFREEPLKDTNLINCEGNLILTPHIGAQTIETQVYAATKIAEKMSNFLKNL